MEGPSLASVLTRAVADRDFVVPAYPATALRLRRVIAADNYTVPQVSDIIASDPALAAAVLRLANSALYRPTGAPVTTVGRAIHRIGARSIATLATASGVGAQACARGPLLDLRYAVWRRAVTCALICQRLAPARDLDAEEAFLAGLLHGFGRTVAVACLEKLLAANAPARPLTTSEWLVLIDEHRAALAQAVAESWELPSELATAIGANSSASSELSRLLALAEELTLGIDRNAPLSNDKLDASELASLTELYVALPGAIAALVEAPPGNRPPPPSAIAKPVTTLKGEVRETSFEVKDARARPGNRLKANAISGDGLRMVSSHPFQESCLVHLSVPADPKPLVIWASVLLCAAAGSDFRVEAQLFSPSRELRAEWLSLFEFARKRQ